MSYTFPTADTLQLEQRPEELPVPPAATALPRAFGEGERVAGRYRIVRFIARGGMGEVYEALDEELGGAVALKTLGAGRPRDAAALERLRQEVVLARRVTHPNVCRIFDFGHDERPDGTRVSFLTMELLEGETLAARLAREPRLTRAEALEIGRQLAAGLAAAHAAGVVHRDLKPGNVLLTAGRAVLMDFGIASSADVSEDGRARGSIGYAAPEQLTGHGISVATDVFSLAVVLHELATGRRPFPPLSAAQLGERMRQPPDLAHELPARWQRALRRALAYEPSRRVGSPLELIRALEPRRPLPWLAAAALLLGLAAAGLFVRRPGSIAPRPAVATLGFADVGGGDAAWVGGAASEMIVARIEAGGAVRVIPADAVAQARAELQLAGQGHPTPEQLARLHTLTGATHVITGSFYAERDGKLWLDARLLDTASGEVVLAATRSGSRAELPALAREVAAEVARRLGERGPVEEPAIAAVVPEDPHAARWYTQGLESLRRADPVAAKEDLERALTTAPDHPLVHFHLARALDQLGHSGAAADEALAARRHAGGLPPLVREEIAALDARLHGDHAAAATLYQRLWSAAPDDVDRGLALLGAQLGTPAGTRTLGQLEALPPPMRDDPRIAITAAAHAEVAGDRPGREAAVARAITLSEASGARLLLASAVRERARLEVSSLRYEAAIASFEEAMRLFGLAGDRRGAARCLLGIGAAQLWKGNAPAARKAWQEALDVFTQLGDLRGAHDAESNLGINLLDDDTEAAAALYRDLIARLPVLHDGSAGLRLTELAEALALGGHLDEAQRKIDEALAGLGGASPFAVDALQVDAYVKLLAGDVEGARRSAERANDLCRQGTFVHGATCPAGHALLARALLESGDDAGAARELDTYRDAVKATPAGDDQTQALSALLALKRGNGRAALEAARSNRAAVPEGQKRRRLRADVLLARAALAAGATQALDAPLTAAAATCSERPRYDAEACGWAALLAWQVKRAPRPATGLPPLLQREAAR